MGRLWWPHIRADTPAQQLWDEGWNPPAALKVEPYYKHYHALYGTADLRLAASTEAQPFPDTSEYASYYAHRRQLAATELRADGVTFRSIGALAVVELPVPARGLSPSTLADIHRERDTFEDWRRALRELARQLPSAESASFRSEAHEAFGDLVLPELDRARRLVARTGRLGEAYREARLNVILGATAAVGVAAAFGHDPFPALAGATAGGFAAMSAKALAKQRPSAIGAVLLSLDHDDPRWLAWDV